jgi:hypothetical protein
LQGILTVPIMLACRQRSEAMRKPLAAATIVFHRPLQRKTGEVVWTAETEFEQAETRFFVGDPSGESADFILAAEVLRFWGELMGSRGLCITTSAPDGTAMVTPSPTP